MKEKSLYKNFIQLYDPMYIIMSMSCNWYSGTESNIAGCYTIVPIFIYSRKTGSDLDLIKECFEIGATINSQEIRDI